MKKPTKFNELADTPSYSGKAGQVPKVNAAENALEFDMRGFELVDDHYFSTAATTYTINGLDGDNDHIYLITVFMNKTLSGTQYILLRPNNDSGTNYRRQLIAAYGANFQGLYQSGMTGFDVAYGEAGTNVSWVPGIWLYAKSGQKRAIHAYRHSDYLTSASAGKWLSYFSVWDNTADNITSLDFVGSEANAISVGSRITVWRKAR